MEYYSAIKKEWIWVSCNEADAPRACYTESNKAEREKNKCRILVHIYRTSKKGTDEPICREERDRDVENGRVDTEGEGGSGTKSASSSDYAH